MLFICFSYGFTGINLIIFSFVIGVQGEEFIDLLIIAIIMFSMVPLSLLDERKKIRGKLNAIMCGVMHFVISVCISYINSFILFMILYVVELVISLIINSVVMNKKR